MPSTVPPILRCVLRPIAASALLALAACGSADDSVIEVAYLGDEESPFQTGVFLSPAAQQVKASTAAGLVGFDEQARVVPGLADRWIVTDDGLSYIFRLRDGTWLDGSPLTAQSARAALNRSLRGLRGTSLGLDLAQIDEVRVMAQRVIEIRLSAPKPNLLQILAQPELGLLREGEGAGPMILGKDANTALLTPLAPQRLGLPEIADWSERTRTVRLSALPAAEAVDRFNDGDVDLVLGGTIADFPLTRSVGILRGTIQLDPVIGLFGLSVLDEDGFLAEPANREALAMAIDRDALIEPFGVAGWKPSSRISAPEVDSGAEPPAERWDGLDIEQRRARAAARVSAWLAAQEGAEAVELTLRLPDGPGSDMLFTRLRDSFTPIGVVLARAEKDKKADLELIDDVARYPAPTWFLHRLNCKARKSACSKEADDLVAEAMRTVDVAGRALLLREAEDTLIAANTYIPLGAPIRWSLVRGNVSGFASNRFGWHPLMPLAMRPK